MPSKIRRRGRTQLELTWPSNYERFVRIGLETQDGDEFGAGMNHGTFLIFPWRDARPRHFQLDFFFSVNCIFRRF